MLVGLSLFTGFARKSEDFRGWDLKFSPGSAITTSAGEGNKVGEKELCVTAYSRMKFFKKSKANFSRCIKESGAI